MNEKKTRSLYGAEENFHADFIPHYIFLLVEKAHANQLPNFTV
jgi:hypothetical protein